MIGIIGAMALEVDLLKERMQEKSEETISGITYVKGKLQGKDVVVAQCGVGKVFAAICAQTMILRYAVSKLINTGVSGALSEKLHIGDVIVASACVEHDMDTSAIGDPVGFISGINRIELPVDTEMADALETVCRKEGVNYIRGLVASGDQFVASEEKSEWLIKTFGAVTAEMETAAIAHVAYVNKVPYAAIRVASDEANGNAPEDFPTFAKEAAKTSSSIVLDWLSIS